MDDPRRDGGCLILPGEAPDRREALIGVGSEGVGEVIRDAAIYLGFRIASLDIRSRELIGSRREPGMQLRVPETTLLVRWEVVEDHPPASRVAWAASQSYANARVANPQANDAYGEALSPHARHASRQKVRENPSGPVVAPGETTPSRWQGEIHDYSALLPPVAAGRAFGRGVLPIGRAAFGQGEDARHSGPVFLPFHGGVPLEQLGVLLCAPQGTGKTHLLIAWAAAAAAAGANVFIVDVKGNMAGQLRQRRRRDGAHGPLLTFSTDPRAPDSDRINFLSGISAGDIDCVEQITRLAEAMLPGERYRGRGEEETRWGLSVTILRGMIQLLKLQEWYAGETLLDDAGAPRETDLADLHDLAGSEGELMSRFILMEERERQWREAGRPLAACSVEECFSCCAIALGSQLPAGWKGPPIDFPGERPKDHTYRQIVWPLLKVLEPFRPRGEIGKRVRGVGRNAQFRFETFGLAEPPMTMILAAREEDSSLATTVLSLTIRRLRQALERRRNMPSEAPRPVLLLLDETSRIAGFNAGEFVTIMRDARVGYVFVYQHLGLIGPPEAITAVMRNIGAQIYLSELRGDDYALFSGELPERRRERWMPTNTFSAGGKQRGETLVAETVPFLERNAAHALPAGRYPALVYLRALRDVAPFLVDLFDPPDPPPP